MRVIAESLDYVCAKRLTQLGADQRVQCAADDAGHGTRQAGHAGRANETYPLDKATPGHFEINPVHHDGATSSRDYVHTVQRMDVTTARSERRVVLDHSYGVMEDAFQRILKRLPFPVLELHPDNGSEFLNTHLARFWKDTLSDLAPSRSWVKRAPRCAHHARHAESLRQWGDPGRHEMVV